MRLQSTLNQGGERWWSTALQAALISGLSLVVCFPLAARPQEEPPSAEASEKKAEPEVTPSDASEKTQQAEESPSAESTADEAGPTEPSDQKFSKSFPVRNGTAAYGRTEEFEKKKTADGEIETKRVRSPYYGGDSGVLYETETRTKNLPDGSIERELVLKNPDATGRMMPIEIIREKTRTTGEATTTDREVLRQDASGKWQPLRKERVTQTGEEKDRKSIKEVRERNLSGDWKVVDRTVTSEKASEAGKATRAVTQRPNAYGELSDFEVREENTSKNGDKETTEVNVRRRDTQDALNPKFFLVERTRAEQTKSAGGKVVRKSVTESDLVAEGASRNVTPGAPKVVEEEVQEETTTADGTTRRVVNVKGRGAVNRELQPAAQIVQETDSKGNVRQILIPSR
jgi:hypothetical protein